MHSEHFLLYDVVKDDFWICIEMMYGHSAVLVPDSNLSSQISCQFIDINFMMQLDKSLF